MDKAEEFIFPIKREQLFEKPSDDRFWLEEDYLYESNIEDSINTLDELTNNPLLIISKPTFALFFSIFRDKSTEAIEDKNRFAQKLLESFYSFTIELEKNIDEIRQNKPITFQNRNALKVYSFFINWIIEQFAYEESSKEKTIKTKTKWHKAKHEHKHGHSKKKGASNNKNITPSKKRKNSLSDNKNDIISTHIDINIQFLLKGLYKLVQIKIEQIFNNKIIENELLNSIIISIFQLLKIKPVPGQQSPIQKEKDKMFLILNSIINQYQSYTNIHIILQNLSTSIIELIYTNETLITNLSEFIYVGITNDSKLLSFANEIIQELITIINKDSKYESQGMKNIGSFFISLEGKAPKLIYNSMPILIKLYESKSYFIRNSISEMIGGIIIDYICKSVESIESADLRNEYYRAKQKFIDILFKRLYDENCFSRNKVLQVFERLCDNNSLGIEDYLELMKEATIRIKDEKAQVRKRAIELLEKVIMIFASVFKCNNHFAELIHIDTEIKNCQAKVDNIKALIHDEDKKDDNSNMIIEQECKNEQENNPPDNNDKKEELFNQLNNEETLIEYYSKYKTVIASINSTIPYIIDLLYSKSISDVIQSISLLKTLNQLNITEAFNGIKKMLNLILSTENTIKKKLKETIISIYFSGDMLISTQLSLVIQLMSNLGDSGLSCFGLIIKEIIEERLIPLSIIKELYIKMLKTTDQSEDRNYLFFIVKASESDKRVIIENAHVYLKILHQRLKKEVIDWRWIKESLNGLMLIQHHLSDKEASVEEIISSILRIMITKGITCNITGITKDDSSNDEWYGACQEIINSIFDIYPNPDVISNNLLNISFKLLAEKHQEGDLNQYKTNRLLRTSKLIFLIGHISLNMINYIDKIQSEIKSNYTSKNQKEEKVEEEKENEAKKEYNIDLVQRLFETQYIYSPQFALHCKLIQSIVSRLFHCSSLEIEANTILYKSAMLSLCKLMCVNGQYCSENLPFIFEILTSDSIPPGIKLNIYVSLGDLINRFPNLLQQYIPKLFACLKDNNATIRRYIVTVISHLVLNDMLKLKGEIVDICLLIETDDQRLKDNILYFFSKISHKGNNIIYNILPKALAKLNEDYSNSSYDKTQEVIKLLVKYIEQDKQIENLLEKMFVKLKGSVNEIEWRNISYCLSLLNYTERHAIKFLELYSTVREKIKYNNIIEENFTNVLNKIKKGNNKDEVEALEKKIMLGKKVEHEGKKGRKKRNFNEIENNSKTKAKTKAKSKKPINKKAKKNKRKYNDDSDDEYDDEDSIEDKLEDDHQESEGDNYDDDDIEMDDS